MKHRRVELGISQRRAADLAGVSPTTWGSLETHAQPVSDLTAAGMSTALRWTPDSIASILAGGDATEATPTDRPLTFTQRNADDVYDRITALEDAVTEVKQAMGELRAEVEAVAESLQADGPPK